MKIIFLIIIFPIFRSYLAETPKSICEGLKPFKTKDNSCDNFTNICVKKDDKDCQTFLNICEQCPAMNYSVLMFHDIALIKVELQNTKNNFNNKADNMQKELSVITIQLRNNENKTSNVYILLWVIIGINILLIIILILEIRFKLFTKIIERRNPRAKAYELLESRKSLRANTSESFETIMQKSSDNILIKIGTKIDEKLEKHLECLQISENKMDEKFAKLFDCLQISMERKARKIKFHINGYMKPIEFNVEDDDCVVQIKKDICSKLSKCNPNDYKVLKLKTKGKILNDNGYLPLSEILSTNEVVYGVFDKTIDASNIVVLKIEIDSNLSKLIQVEKSQSISNLVISNFGIDNSENFTYFTDINNNKTGRESYIELEKGKTIKELNLQDDDTIFVIKRIPEELVLESIFEKETISIEFTNTDKISEIKQSVANKFNCFPKDIILFLKNTHLDENMFAFQYISKNNREVKYCRLINFALANIEFEKDALVTGCFSQLYKGKFTKRHQDILVKKYDMKMNEKLEDCKHIIGELKTFQTTKSEERFVKLFGVYKNDNFIFVSMENMSEGSLKMFLKKYSNNGIDLYVVAKWTDQILEGLHYLHENNIIHRDLNPSSLLLDSNCNIKLSSFNLSKYTEFHTPSSINVNSYKVDNEHLKGIPIQYLAPEIISMKTFNSKADVWSLGAILIRISTKKNPYSGMKKEDKIKRIENQNYECPDSIPSELRKFIDLCMKRNPEERETVENLQKDKFIRDYYRS